MIKFLSNVIDDVGINIYNMINKSKTKSKIGKDINKIKEELEFYNTKRIFEKAVNSDKIIYKSIPYQDLTTYISNITLNQFECKSEYEPFKPFKNKYNSNKNLHTIKGIYTGKTSNKKAMILIHGYFERNYDLYRLFVLPKIVNDLHTDVFAYELPHHMNRTISSSSYSGEEFFSGDPLNTIEAFRQSVTEITQLSYNLREKYDELYLCGINIGGNTALYTTIVDNSFDKYILIQTGASLNEYIMNIGKLSQNFINNSINNGIINESDFYKTYKTLDFTKYKYIVDPSKITIVAGKYDNIIPFGNVRKLVDHLGKTKTIYYDGGNFSINFIYNIIMEQSLSNVNIRRRNY